MQYKNNFFLKNRIVFIFFVILIIFQITNFTINRINFDINNILNAFKPDYGEKEALPTELIEIKKILKKHNLKEFNLDKELILNTYYYQRTIEYFYPIKFNENSSYIISKEKNTQSECKKLFANSKLIFEKC